MSKEVFESAVRSRGDLAGVFECDGETGYFYLSDQTRKDGEMVVDSVWLLNGQADFDQVDVAVEWDENEAYSGLFIRGQLWAVFDTKSGAKYGGNYRKGGRPEVPPQISEAFAPT